jgi:hypothetical protein
MSDLTNTLRTIGERLPDLKETHFGFLQVCANAADHIDSLEASCQEFLPILERQLASINPGGAAEGSIAFQTAKARVDRMRDALVKAGSTANREGEP